MGWRSGHEAALRGGSQRPGFIEVHSENFFGQTSAARRLLLHARRDHAVSLHGVGLGLGSAAGLDLAHLAHLAHLVQQVQPARVSDHAAFARAPRRPGGPVLHANDLLPLAFTEASLRLLVAQVQQVQDRLRRPLLVENLSAYLRWARPEMDEAEFFNRLVQRSGCGLLLDLNNLVVNARNDLAAAQGPAALGQPRAGDGAGRQRRREPAPDPVADAAVLAQVLGLVQRLQPGVVQQVHLAGHGLVDGLAIDDHGSAVPALVWQAYRALLARTGPVPTLVEWDTRLPPFEALLAESDQAAQVMADVLGAADPGPARPAASRGAHLRPLQEARPWASAAGGGMAAEKAKTAAEATEPTEALTTTDASTSTEAQRQQALVATLWQPVGSLAAAQAESALALWLDPQALPAALGLRAYRGHARALAPRGLAQVFPVVAALVGAQAWAQLARRHWLAHPPTQGDLGAWGTQLPRALAADARLADWPWLADVARLELAVHQAERGPDASARARAAVPAVLADGAHRPGPAEPFDAQDGHPGDGAAGLLAQLAGADPAACGLRLAPGAALCASPWPVVALWQAHQGKAPQGKAYHGEAAAEPDLGAAQALLAAGTGQTAWVWRAADQVQVQAIGLGDAACLQALMAGQALAAAMDAAEAREPGWSFEAWLHQALGRAWCVGLVDLA